MDSCTTGGVGKILVGDLMSTEVIRVKPGDSVVEVGNLLAEKRISGAVVSERDNILGVISKESFVTGVKYMGENPIDSFTVRDFMAEKYDTASVEESLDEVVDRIAVSPHRVDRLIVLDKGRLAGILTQSDIARVFAGHAGGCFKVRDLMQLNPIIVNDYDQIVKILQEITLARDKRVIVMAGQKVLGVITVLDLSLALFEKLKQQPGKDVLDLITLEDIITLDPILAKESDDAADAARLMVENRIGGLPVYENELKGVITKTDIVKGYKISKDTKRLK